MAWWLNMTTITLSGTNATSHEIAVWTTLSYVSDKIFQTGYFFHRTARMCIWTDQLSEFRNAIPHYAMCQLISCGGRQRHSLSIKLWKKRKKHRCLAVVINGRIVDAVKKDCRPWTGYGPPASGDPLRMLFMQEQLWTWIKSDEHTTNDTICVSRVSLRDVVR